MVASVALWSTTPASNTGLDTGANFPEGMAPSAVNDGMRGVQAAVRKLYNDTAGKIVAGGSANAITITTQSSWAALADGISVVFRAANTNSNSTVTLALDGLTAKNCYHADGTALAVGDIVSGGIYIAAYSSIANASAGGWLILNAVSAVWSGAAAAEVTVASASTCDILGAASVLVAISGTTTITSLGTGASRVRFVRFTGALTLTHNGTSLILPGGASITTAAGDTMIVESDASSNARVLVYQKANGQAVISPAVFTGDSGSGGATGIVPAPAAGDAAKGLMLGAGGSFTYPRFAPDVIVEDQKTSGTNGGTFTSGADRTRDLNTEVRDSNSYCTVSSNQVTLVAGTWYIEWDATCYAAGVNQSFLYDITGAAVLKRGSSDRADNATLGTNRSVGSYVGTFAGSNVFEVRHRCGTTQATNGFGVAASFGTEVYTRFRAWKIG